MKKNLAMAYAKTKREKGRHHGQPRQNREDLHKAREEMPDEKGEKSIGNDASCGMKTLKFRKTSRRSNPA